MSAALLRWSASLGFQLAASLARLLGARVASALFVSATGKVMLKLLVHSVGGPLALVPQHLLASAVNSVVPSPVLLLRGVRAGVRVMYLLLETPLTQGARRLLVRLHDGAASGPEQRAQWLSATPPARIDEYTPTTPVLRLAPSPAPVASVRRVQDLDAEATSAALEQRRAELALAQSSVVLDLHEDALRAVEEEFDGDRATVTASALSDFLRTHGRDDAAALSANRVVTDATWEADATWQPAELCVHSRRDVQGDAELSAALSVPVSADTASPSTAEEMRDESDDGDWVTLAQLSVPLSDSSNPLPMCSARQ